MTIKEQIQNILLENFRTIYCDTCRFQNTNMCDDCHRRYMNWSLSPKIADQLAEKILTETIVEEKQYEHCDSYTVINSTPRCLGTKEIDVCHCKGNKYQCDFYDYSK